MAVNPIRILRNYVTGVRPPSTRAEGEPYVNFADRQFGVIDSGGNAIDLVGVRAFSTTAAYAAGATVNYNGQLYQSLVAITTPGAWNPAQWVSYMTFTTSRAGVSDGSNASAGQIGEFLTASASAVAAAAATNVNVATLSLTAGDWDVSGFAQYVNAGNPAQSLLAAISQTAGTWPSTLYTQLNLGTANIASNSTIATGIVRASFAATTTVFLIGYVSGFAAGSATFNGYMRARRVR